MLYKMKVGIHMTCLYYDKNKEFVYGQYYAIYLPEHHLSDVNGIVYVHRLLAEMKLGRPLLSTECVHHVDEDKFNNAIENLMIFKTKKDHSMFHNGCNIVLDVAVYVAVMEDTRRICPECGSHKNIGAIMCLLCRHKKLRSSIPEKEELYDLIQHMSYVEIGKRYGVSDSSVRKWCTNYDIKRICNYCIPSKTELMDLLLCHSQRDIAKLYNVTLDMIRGWLQMYDIIVSSGLEVKCVETGIIYNNKAMAAKIMYSDLSVHSATNGISKVCDLNKAYRCYHWQSVNKHIL